MFSGRPDNPLRSSEYLAAVVEIISIPNVREFAEHDPITTKFLIFSA